MRPQPHHGLVQQYEPLARYHRVGLKAQTPRGRESDRQQRPMRQIAGLPTRKRPDHGLVNIGRHHLDLTLPDQAWLTLTEQTIRVQDHTLDSE